MSFGQLNGSRESLATGERTKESSREQLLRSQIQRFNRAARMSKLIVKQTEQTPQFPRDTLNADLLSQDNSDSSVDSKSFHRQQFPLGHPIQQFPTSPS